MTVSGIAVLMGLAGCARSENRYLQRESHTLKCA